MVCEAPRQRLRVAAITTCGDRKPEPVQELLREGKLSAGHARALLALSDPEKMLELAQRVAGQQISVRELERMVRRLQQEAAEPAQAMQKARRLPYFQEVELALHDHLGRKVQVQGTEKKGTLQIEFYGQEDLSELIRLLHLNPETGKEEYDA